MASSGNLFYITKWNITDGRQAVKLRGFFAKIQRNPTACGWQ
ncbi:hypothetical protein X874_14220 [Mannheimia varigena USDA-ARS-USMARC-1312]|nr:hypothetical protein X874_14220 [Mannheimia varigena USDA-ARS-USMARC-1312]